jgi:hypothetical protein
MFERNILGTIFVILSLTALIFLLYTLINLDKLGITATHPRVIVEFSLFLTFLLIAISLRYYK